MINLSNKKRYLQIFAMISLMIAVLIPLSCGSKSNNSEEDDDDTTQVPNDVTEAVDDSPQPNKGIIIFDGSSSMQGYVDATTAGSFQAVVGELNNLGKNTESYTFDSEKHQIDNFLSKIQNRKIKWSDQSDLFMMVKDIMTKAGMEPSNCQILITDGIISGSNEEIKADPSYNISKPALLSARIDSIVSRLPREKNISLLVAKWNTPFKGTYYEYDNKKKHLNNEMRPFYVLVAGSAPKVAYAEKMLSDKEGIEAVQYGTIYPVTAKLTNGTFINKNHYKVNSEMKQEGPVAEVNVASLPPYARNLNYLQKNLEIVKSTGKDKKNQRTLEKENDYQLSLENNKLTVTFADKIKNQLPATFEFRIKRVQPQWVADATTHDDKAGYSPSKTFNLDYFLNPFLKLNGKELLNDSGESTIEITK